MEIYVLHTSITFKKHCIYQYFKPFYLSRLFIVGILSQLSLNDGFLSVSIKILYFSGCR